VIVLLLHSPLRVMMQHGQSARGALDSNKFFIIVPDMLDNGLSSSPTMRHCPAARAAFQRVTIHDNVKQQYRLFTESFDIKTIQFAIGGSLGGA
jgi:homoserine O-acetyltransferase